MLSRQSNPGMSEATLAEWLQRIASIHPKEVELGLERVSAVAHRLSLLPVAQPVVTVAGTNGKGSVVAVLEVLFEEAGCSTGAYTSPHLLRFNERIRVSGREVSDTEIIDAFRAIDETRGTIELTYFEFATLAALFIFKIRSPDIIILEVGLGGRLDAVNAVDASVAVITSIDLDHQDWLGETRGEIALEKAGIVRRCTPVVVGDPDPPVELEQQISQVGALPALFLGREYRLTTEQGQWRARLLDARGEERDIGPYPIGSLLPQNVCSAVQAALLLGVDFNADTLARALSRASPPGRRQWRHSGGRDYLLDVAHNPAAVSKLVEYINLIPCNGRTICIFSIMADKDLKGVVNAAAGHFDAWFLAEQPDNPRAAQAAHIASLLVKAGQTVVSVSKNLRQALRRAHKVSREGDRLVVFGSFYTVAGVLPLLDREQEMYEAS